MIDVTAYLPTCELAVTVALAWCCALLISSRVTRQRRLLGAVMERHGHRLEPIPHRDIAQELRHD